MANAIITQKELNVPVGAVLEVAEALLENEITNNIIGTDEDDDELIIEVQYDKEQREVIHKIEDIIAEYNESEDQEEEETEEES